MSAELQEPDELRFASFDETTLVYRAWLPEGAFDKAILLFHRGHEYSGRFEELAKQLLESTPGAAIFAWDARGHGRSPGERGYADHIMDVVRDVDSFVSFVSRTYHVPMENISVLGHSVAAVVVGLWIHDYAPRIRAAILATPALRVKLYVPFALPALRLQLWWKRRRGGRTPFVKSYVKGKLLTHDPVEAEKYDGDPLISNQIAVNILLNLHDASTRLLSDAGAISTPVLLLIARTDWVVKNKPARLFYERLSSTTKRAGVYRNFYHAIFHEADRAQPIEACQKFLAEVYAQSPEAKNLLDADKAGFTADEYQWMKAGLPPISLRRFGYRLTRLAMRTLGQLSDGIRLGWKTGFDSGSSLDYVYRNTAQGITPLGRFLDRQYLDSPGWQGIRERKRSIEALLEKSINSTAERRGGEPIAIMDIAGGPARYLLDTVKRRADLRFDVRVRDWSVEGLNEGKALAEAMGISSVTFEQADAFDKTGFGAITPKLDIVIASGIYELFPDNPRVLDSLRGIFQSLKAGGYLIYTNQPWHPQLEFIAEVLTNREGKPWVMRRRTQAEMDELVRSVGFEKLAMKIDNEGIFTVSLAQRK